jgi:site-specific DNA-methyltransferase (adenine-specific)
MITVTNEDCMALMSRYPDKHFDLAIVDVPYGINQGGDKNYTRSKRAVAKKYKPFNDSSTPDKIYFDVLLVKSKHQIIFGANHFIEKIPFRSSCWIIWDKDNGETDFADCEIAWTNFNTAIRRFKYKWSGMLQENMKNKEQRIHPCQKPVALYKWILKNYAKPGYKILDTHLGSGSIAIACHDFNLDLTACEIDADYYRAAMERITEHQKQKSLFEGEDLPWKN